MTRVTKRKIIIFKTILLLGYCNYGFDLSFQSFSTFSWVNAMQSNFLIVNSEFKSDTILEGFEFLAYASGYVDIYV
jgi:hypothetical protein